MVIDQETPTPSVLHKLITWSWLWLSVSFFVVGVSWALSSPVGSAPDDDYHLTSIWCATGEREGACVDTGLTPPKFIVTAGAVNSSFCYATKPDQTGDCADYELNSTELVLTDRLNNIQQLYPGGYYAVMSIFVGPDVEKSVYFMRIFNVLVTSILLGLLLRLAPRGIGQASALTIVAAYIPLGLFLIASTNPSGWAISGVLFFLAYSLCLMFQDSWRSGKTWVLAGGVVATGLMAITSRVDSAAFIVVAVVLISILAGFTRIRAQIAGYLILLVMALLGIWTYFAVTPLTGEVVLGSAEPAASLLWNNLVNIPSLIYGIVGDWPLGWNDTPLPSLVSVVGILVVGALAYAGFSDVSTRKLVVVALAFIALVGFPVAFLQSQSAGINEVIQSRYLLPLFAIFIFTVLLAVRVDQPIRLSKTPIVLMAIALWVSSSVAFWVNTHRYSMGNSVSLFEVDVAWSSMPSLAGITLLAVISSGIFVCGAFAYSYREGEWRRIGDSNP